MQTMQTTQTRVFKQVTRRRRAVASDDQRTLTLQRRVYCRLAQIVSHVSIPSSCVGVEKWKIDSVAINAQKHHC